MGFIILFAICCALVILIMLGFIVYTIATGQFHALPKEIIITAIPSLILFLMFKFCKNGENKTPEKNVQEIKNEKSPPLLNGKVKDIMSELPEHYKEKNAGGTSKIKPSPIVVNDVNEISAITLVNENNFKVFKDYNKTTKYDDTFVVFDLETTGLNPQRCEIIEIGAIKYINGQESEKFQTYIKPDMPIPENVSKINNIYDKTVENAPKIKEVIPKFLEFISGFTLVAHNASFDMSFIQTQIRRFSENIIQNSVVDTLQLARKTFPFLKNHKLTTIKDYLKMNVDSHNALDDCSVTAKLYLVSQAERNRIKELERNYKLHQAEIQLKELEETDMQTVDDKGYFYSNLGILCENLEKVDKAIKYYQLSVDNDFSGKHPYKRLVVLYRKNKEYENEIKICEKALQIFDVESVQNDFKKRMETSKSRLAK